MDNTEDFFKNYRGRYSQYWIERWGLIPELPTSFDNGNSMYELMAWLQRAFKNLLDDFQQLEAESEDFKNAIIDLLEYLIPELIRRYHDSAEFRVIFITLLEDILAGEERTWVKDLLKELIEVDMREWIEDYLKELNSLVMKEFFDEINAKLAQKANMNDIFVSVMWFGAKGNGIDSDSQAIFDAVSYVRSKGGGTVFFPNTGSSYIVDRAMTVHENIDLIGNKTKLKRTHNYEVAPEVFNFLGNNTMSGFIYDGGLESIPNVGTPNEFTMYSDFISYGLGLTFKDNVVINCKGTLIGGKSNVVVYNNRFGEFGDHVVYMGGSSNSKTENVIVTNNIFTAPTSARDVIKFRNSGENIVISDNIFDCPLSTIFNFSLGDNTNPQGDLKNINVSNNTIIRAFRFTYITQNNTPNSIAQGNIYGITFQNNLIDNVTYINIGNSYWAYEETLNLFSGSPLISFLNNTFKKMPAVHTTSKQDELKIVFKGNTCNIKNDSTGVFGVFHVSGNVSLEISDNTFVSDIAMNNTLIKSPFTDARNINKGVKPTNNTHFIIKNNVFKGFRIVFEENNGNGEAYLNDKTSLIISDNTFLKNGLQPTLGASIGTSIVSLQNNMCIHDGAFKGVTSTYPAEKIVVNDYQNALPQSGEGTPNGKGITPRFVFDRYIDITNKQVYMAFSLAQTWTLMSGV